MFSTKQIKYLWLEEAGGTNDVGLVPTLANLVVVALVLLLVVLAFCAIALGSVTITGVRQSIISVNATLAFATM